MKINMGLRTKLEAAGIIILVALIGLLYYYVNQNSKNKADKVRMTENLYNANNEIDSVKLKNGSYLATVKTLTLKANEASNYKSTLLSQLSAMQLKVKNLQSATTTGFEYNFNTDSTNYYKGKIDSLKINPKVFYIDKKSDTTFNATFEDSYLKISQKIALINKFNNIKIQNFTMQLKDSITTAYKYRYKTVWLFWHKKTGIDVYLKSNNPYFKLNFMQSMNFE
jgi:hypothetical protein